MNLSLSLLPGAFSVCQVPDLSEAPVQDDFCFLAKTPDEFSLVCETRHIPSRCLSREDGWRALRVDGPLDFALIGILAKISAALAESEISIFAVSTYDTDYILVREEQIDTSVKALRCAGFEVKL